jgi:hypothetical protein
MWGQIRTIERILHSLGHRLVELSHDHYRVIYGRVAKMKGACSLRRISPSEYRYCPIRQ